MAMANTEYNRVLTHVVDSAVVNVRLQELTSKIASPENGFLVVHLKDVDDLIGDSHGLVLLSRVLGQLASGITELPHVEVQLASLHIDSDDVGVIEPEVAVLIWRGDTSTRRCVAKHGVASHLDVDNVLPPIAVLPRDDPFTALAATSEGMDDCPILGVHQSLTVAVPV